MNVHRLTVQSGLAVTVTAVLGIVGSGGGWLVASAASAAAPSFAVYVGYADTLRPPPSGTGIPRPWIGDGNFLYDTCGGCLHTTALLDTGAIRIDNLSSGQLSIASVEVDILTNRIKTWSQVDVRSNSTLILASGPDAFDTSDSTSGCLPSDTVPMLRITIGSQEFDYRDSGQVLNTGGNDRAVCSPGASEAHDWQFVQAQPPVTVTPPPPTTVPKQSPNSWWPNWLHLPSLSWPNWLHLNVDVSVDLSTLLETLLAGNAVTTGLIAYKRRDALPRWLVALLVALAVGLGAAAVGLLFFTRTAATGQSSQGHPPPPGGVSNGVILAAVLILGLAGIAATLFMLAPRQRFIGGGRRRKDELDQWILERAKVVGIPDQLHRLHDLHGRARRSSSDASEEPDPTRPIVEFLDDVGRLARRGYIDERFWVAFFQRAIRACVPFKGWRNRYKNLDELCRIVKEEETPTSPVP